MIGSVRTYIFRMLAGLVVGGAAVLFVVAPVQAQSSTFEEAKGAYRFAEWDKAVRLFSEVAQNTAARDSIRQEALCFLGRAYIALDQPNQARKAMNRLVKMDPKVELDPNRNPHELMIIYYEVLKETTGGYDFQRQGPGLQTLAIMDFSNSSVTDGERWGSLSAGFPSMMINFLSGGTTELQVIERQRIDWLLKELKLQKKADVVDQSTAVKVGNILGATSVLFGNYIVHEDRMRIGARLVKVETSEILLAEQVVGEPDDFFELVKDLSVKVARSINLTLEETELGTATETQSLDAKIAFSKGLRDLDDGNYQAAYEHFQDALDRDPKYELAKRRMESLKPQLAAANPDSTDASGGGRPDDTNW